MLLLTKLWEQSRKEKRINYVPNYLLDSPSKWTLYNFAVFHLTYLPKKTIEMDNIVIYIQLHSSTLDMDNFSDLSNTYNQPLSIFHQEIIHMLYNEIHNCYCNFLMFFISFCNCSTLISHFELKVHEF